MKDCICKELEKVGEIDGFNSEFEFIKFEKELHSDVVDGELIEVGFHRNQFWERIFKCSKCSTLWILTEPDFPYKGHWKKK